MRAMAQLLSRTMLQVVSKPLQLSRDTDKSGARRFVQYLTDARQQSGAGPWLWQEGQRRIERVFSPPRSGVAARKEEGGLAPFPAVALIQPAPTQPAHDEVGEDEMDRRRVLAQELQGFNPVGRRQHGVPGVLECVR